MDSPHINIKITIDPVAQIISHHLPMKTQTPHMTTHIHMLMTMMNPYLPALQSTLWCQAQDQFRQPAPTFLKGPAHVTREMSFSIPMHKFKVLSFSAHRRES